MKNLPGVRAWERMAHHHRSRGCMWNKASSSEPTCCYTFGTLGTIRSKCSRAVVFVVHQAECQLYGRHQATVARLVAVWYVSSKGGSAGCCVADISNGSNASGWKAFLAKSPLQLCCTLLLWTLALAITSLWGFFCGLNICSIFYVPNIVICLFCLNHIRGPCILGFSCASYDQGSVGPTILVLVPESEPVSKDVAAKLPRILGSRKGKV